MAAVTDLVMPKLGLTMTEGRIARWAVQPGARFAKGACVVEIETDKIVNEVEAPTDGVMIAQVAAMGETVDVATVIARWQLDDAAAPPPAGIGNRIIATPYARRLARQVGLTLDEVSGTGPNGRIKAADVTRIAGGAVAATTVPLAMPILTAQAAPAPLLRKTSPTASSVALSFVIADIDATRWLELERGMARARGRPIARGHIAAAACLRAMERIHPSRRAFSLGLSSAPFGDDIAWIETRGGVSWIALAEQMRGAPLASTGGDMLIHEGLAEARLFAPAVPAGWGAVLTIGATRTVAHRGASDTLLWGDEISLALSYSATHLKHATALALLADIKSALEDPLHLLAS